MEIIKYPDVRLFKACKLVNVFDENLQTLLEAMWETMKREHGIGLAANQVGLDQRMFTMEGKDQEKIFLVNPKILEFGKTPSPLKEGCLSAPGQMINLFRPIWVKVAYQDQTGKSHERVFSDIHSVCVQHEIEHLEGKSFLQNKSIPKATRKELAQKWGIKLK